MKLLYAVMMLYILCSNSCIGQHQSVAAASSEGKHSLHFQPIDATEAKQIERWIQNGEADIFQFFNSNFQKSYDVYIYSDRDSLDRQWQKDWNMPTFQSECWMVASGVAHRLDILSPRIWETQACEHDQSDTVSTKQLIIHELVHVFHGQNNPSPTFDDTDNIDWLVEGIAVYASGQLDESRYARAQNTIIEKGAPKKLADIWKGEHRYGYAGSLVQYIDQQYGRDVLIQLIQYNKIADVLNELNISEEQLLSDWEKSFY